LGCLQADFERIVATQKQVDPLVCLNSEGDFRSQSHELTRVRKLVRSGLNCRELDKT